MTTSTPGAPVTRSRRRRRSVATALAALALVATGCGDDGDSASADGLTKVGFALPIPAMEAGFAELPVAVDQGFFADEGLEVEAQMLESSANALQALATGRIDIAAPTPDALIAAIGQGQDVKIVYEWNRAPTQYYAVLPDSGLADVADLDGKTIGVSALGSGAKVMSDVALRETGIDPEADVSYVAVGVGAAALDALQKEKIDALMLWSAQYAGMENTGAELSYIRPDALANLFATSLAVTSEFIAEDAEVIERFGRAWARATEFIAENPEEAIRSLWKLYPGTRGAGDEAAEMEKALNVMNSVHVLNVAGDPGASGSWGEVTDEQIADWLDVAREVGLVGDDVAPEDVYTNEFVEAFNSDS